MQSSASPPQRCPPEGDVRVSGDAIDGSAHELYMRYAPLLRHVAMRRFRVPIEEVDALVHDVFATYLTDPERIESIRPYLLGGICNAARQYWRRRDRDVELDEGDEVVDERTLDRIATRLDVAATLARLGTRCREALRRYYMEGESTPVIAEFLDTTPKNVNYLLHVCRKRARAVFDSMARCI